MLMVLIVDDNKNMTAALEDILDLEDIKSKAVYDPETFLRLMDDKDFFNFSIIIMDYNLEAPLNGINLLMRADERNLLHDKKVYFYSGNVNYINGDEREFLADRKITIFEKTQMSEMISSIIKDVTKE